MREPVVAVTVQSLVQNNLYNHVSVCCKDDFDELDIADIDGNILNEAPKYVGCSDCGAISLYVLPKEDEDD